MIDFAGQNGLTFHNPGLETHGRMILDKGLQDTGKRYGITTRIGDRRGTFEVHLELFQ